MKRVLVGLTCMGLVAGCDGDSRFGPEEDPVPASLAVVEGADQTGAVASQLESPVVVEVADSDGVGLRDVDVVWSVDDDGVVPATSVTDADGRATVDWTLGSTAGTQTLHASVDGLDPIAIHATGTAIALECEAGSAVTINGTTAGTLDDECVDDQGRHYYTHTLDVDTSRTVEFSSESDAFTPHFQIRDSQGGVVLPDSVGDASNRIVLGPGTYGVQVRTSLEEAGMGGSYTLDAVSAETDPNACGDETFITVRGSVVGDFGDGDCVDEETGASYDAYPVVLMQDRTYELTLSASGEARATVLQYDVVAEEWQETDTEEGDAGEPAGYMLSFTVTEPGIQYVRIAGMAGDYSFTIDEAPDQDQDTDQSDV